MNWRNPWLILAAGILVGYSASRILDNVPIIRSIPKIRI